MDNDFPTMLTGQRNQKQGFIGAMLKGLNPFMNKIPQHHQAIQPLFGFATGKGMTVGDETGLATFSPTGSLQLAGVNNAFEINPLMRKVAATYIDPKSNFKIGGYFGMGPQDNYDPTVGIDFQFGTPQQQNMMMPNRIQIEGLPEEEMQAPMISPARAYEMQQTKQYQENNPFYYR
jgi:hypothetical protein